MAGNFFLVFTLWSWFHAFLSLALFKVDLSSPDILMGYILSLVW